MTMRSILAVSVALGLAGCLGGGEAPSELLTLTASQSPPAAQRSTQTDRLVTIITPGAPKALSNNRIPVYVSDTIIQYLQDAYWVEQPAELFRNLLSEMVGARSSHVVVDSALYTQTAGTSLSGQLLKFGLDPNSLEAVIVFDGAVTRPDGSVATRRFETRLPVADVSRASVAPALNEAANQVAADVAAWLG